MSNIIELYHTSPVKIEKITKDGLFGSALFFSEEPYFMNGGESHVYKIEVDEDDIVEVFRLDSPEHVKEIEELTGFSAETCDSLLDGRKSYWQCLQDTAEVDVFCEHADAAWEIQAIQLRAAVAAGYMGAKMEDEQGTCWAIDMMGREAILEYVKTVREGM